MKRLILPAVLLAAALPAAAETAATQVAGYLAAAGAATADPAAGQALFMATHTGGKPDTPTCTTCHGADLTKAGQTRAGKPIDPMAPSVQPDRYTDPAKVEKWFGRNCNSVLGRDCTAAEKADILAWLAGL